MSTVTAVPLQPVKRSYLVYLWVGIALACIAAFALARQGDDFLTRNARARGVVTTPSGLQYKVLQPGAPGAPKPTDADVALINYEGKLLNGTVSGVALIRESSTNMNLFTQCGIYVVDSGGSVLATLIAPQTTGGVEANNPSANNRMYPRGNSGSGVSLSSYTTVNATSRIVIEVGLRLETTRTGDSGYCYIGNDGGSDLPLGDGTDNSTTKNPWFEFSVDIFTPPAGGGGRSQGSAFYGSHHEDDPDLAGWKRRRSGLLVRC